MFESFEKKQSETSVEKYKDEFDQLRVIREVLSEAGLCVCDYPNEMIVEQFELRNAVPVAMEGAQGIRVSRKREGGLLISFTNGFENPKDLKRIKVTAALREKGIDVV